MSELKQTTEEIEGRVIDTEGNISKVTQTVDGLTITTDEGSTYIDGGKIATKTVKAESVDVEDIFAKDIEATGSVTGLTFISEGELTEDNLGESMPPALLLLNESKLNASNALISMIAGEEEYDHVKAEHSAFGSQYKAASEDDLGLVGGYAEQILDVNSYGLNFRARKSGETNFLSLFEVGLEGAYWEDSKLISRTDLDKILNDLAVEGGIVLEETDPTVPAWAKRETKPTYTAVEVGARPNTWTPSASDVGADPEGTAEEKVSGHNTNTEAHNDIRLLIEGLNTRLNALADSDDVTLDQMSELVAYIKDNRELIEGVTTNKVNVSDIIDNLTTNVSNKPLSAAQGVVLKGLIDALSEAFNNHASDKVAHITAAERTAWNAKADKKDIPTKYSDLTDDIGYVKREDFDGHKHVWKDITDRAFGEFPTDKGIDTVISNDIVHGKYVKVSDAIPTLAEVQQGGTVTYYNVADGEITGELVTANFPEGDYRVTESTNGIRINYDGVPIALISYNGNPTFGAVTFPDITEAGVYFDAGLYRCMHSLTINNYTGFEVIRTLPKKYLPKDIGAVKTVNNTAPDEAGNININIEANKAFTSVYSNILKWDGNTTGLPSIGNADFKVYDEAPTVAEASEGGYFKYEENGEIKTFTFTADDVSPWNDDIFAIYGSDFGEIIVVSKDGASSEDLTDLEKGVYISSYSSKYISEIMFNGYVFATQVLKGECLPKHEHSWRDIKDPLFGEVKSGNGDTVVSDKVVYGNYHKVSDAVPTLADINKGVQLTYHWVEDGKVSRNSRTFDSTDQYYWVFESTAGIVITYDGTPLVVISFTGSSAIGGWTFEGITEAGTYFRQDSYYCTSAFTVTEYTSYPYMFEKIPERYLPEDYIKQLVKEVIAELVGTDTDGLKDINGDELYDMLSRKLIAKE